MQGKMEVTLLLFTLLLCTTTIVNSESFTEPDILRRIEQLEKRERSQQVELDTLRKQNNAMEDEIKQLKVRDEHHIRRIDVLEELKRELMETIDLLKNGIRSSVMQPPDEMVRPAKGNNLNRSGKGEHDAHDTLDVLKNDIESSEAASVEKVRSQAGNNYNAGNEESARPSNSHQRIRQTDNSVAFFATLTQHAEHLGHNQAIIFDNAITNLGQAYSPFTGVFTAPTTGVYVFSATIVSDRAAALFGFAVNGVVRSHMYAYSTEAYETLSMTAVFQLTPGNEVAIWNEDSDNLVQGYHVSSFAGFLLA